MAVFFRKTHHFIFYGGAVTGTDTFNYPGVHRGLVDPLTDDFVGPGIGVGDVAGTLFQLIVAA